MVGGLLFVVSDMTLAIALFAAETPEPLRTLTVIGMYVPARVLLTAGALRLFRRRRRPVDHLTGL